MTDTPALEALTEALHSGALDSGEPLCSMRHLPVDLCPAAPHQRHAAAILAALTANGFTIAPVAEADEVAEAWLAQLHRLVENEGHRKAAMTAIVESRSQGTDLWFAELLTAAAAIAAALQDEEGRT